MEDNTTCKNCGYQLKPIYKHCPECGQKVNDDLTLSILFSNTISNYFSVDARFFRSFLPLIFRPGYLARKFVEGKRLTYLHPAQFYLFISVVFFFILSFKVREYNAATDKAMKEGFKLEKKINSGKDNDSVSVVPLLDSAEVAKFKDPILNNPNITAGMGEEDLKKLDSTLTTELAKNPKNQFNFGYNTQKMDSLIAINASETELLKLLGIKEDAGFIKKSFGRQMIKFHKQQGSGFVQAISDTVPIAIFFLLPIFALILKVFHWRRGRFAHHLVFSFYYFSFLFIVLAIIIGVNQFLWKIPGWLIGLLFLYMFIYLWLSIRYFYRQGYIISFIKSGIISFIYMLFNFTVALALIIAASFLFY